MNSSLMIAITPNASDAVTTFASDQWNVRALQQVSPVESLPFDLLACIPRPRSLAPLYTPRTRSILRKSFGGEFPGPGKIGLPVPHNCLDDGLSDFDLEIWSGGRISVSRLDIVTDRFQPFAPFIARKQFVPLHVEMIPSSSFGASLANLLERETWKEIRRPFFKDAGYVCQLCGEANGPVEGHEVWNFDDTGHDGGGWHKQTLQTILCLCHECHEVFHPGLAQINGRTHLVRERLCALNCWTADDYSRYASFAIRQQRKRSSKRWQLDLSVLQRKETMRLATGWEPTKSGSLVKRTATGFTTTRVTGGTLGY